jgi:hypothetical protein
MSGLSPGSAQPPCSLSTTCCATLANLAGAPPPNERRVHRRLLVKLPLYDSTVAFSNDIVRNANRNHVPFEFKNHMPILPLVKCENTIKIKVYPDLDSIFLCNGNRIILGDFVRNLRTDTEWSRLLFENLPSFSEYQVRQFSPIGSWVFRF